MSQIWIVFEADPPASRTVNVSGVAADADDNNVAAIANEMTNALFMKMPAPDSVALWPPLGKQHDLADVAAFSDHSLRVSGLLERK